MIKIFLVQKLPIFKGAAGPFGGFLQEYSDLALFKAGGASFLTHSLTKWWLGAVVKHNKSTGALLGGVPEIQGTSCHGRHKQRCCPDGAGDHCGRLFQLRTVGPRIPHSCGVPHHRLRWAGGGGSTFTPGW